MHQAPMGMAPLVSNDDMLRKVRDEILKDSGKQDGRGDAKKKKGMLRAAGGERWFDPNLVEWPENDFRIFVGDLGNEVTDEILSRAFRQYASFNKAKVRACIPMPVSITCIAPINLAS